MLTLAGERGWLPMSSNLVPSRVLRSTGTTLRGRRRGAGRPPDRANWRISREVHVAETPEQARREALDGDVRARLVTVPAAPPARDQHAIAPRSIPPMPDDAVTLDYLLRQRLDRRRRRGGDRQALPPARGGRRLRHPPDMGHEWTSGEQWPRSMRLLAEEVIPRLRERIGTPAASA